MFDLKPHQERAVAKMHNGSILYAEPGTGKTHTALGYYLATEAPRNIYVITTAKKRDSLDWEHTALEAGISSDPASTLGSVITVDSWNNIGNYTEVENGFFIFDEQRLVGSGAWTKAFLKIAKRNRWILLSATPGDTWIDYIPVFVANGFVKNRTAFKERYVRYAPWSKFPKVVGYNHVGELVKWRNQLLVHMPYERHTTRVSTIVSVGYDQELLRKVVKERWHVYEERPLKDVAELFSVMKKVVYSDPSRLQAIRSLMAQHPKLIVFYQYDYELEILRSLSDGPWSDSQMEKPPRSTLQRNNTNSSVEEFSPTSQSEMTDFQTISRRGKIQDDWDYLLRENLKFAVKQTRLYSQKTGDGPKRGFEGSSEKRSLAVAEWNGHKHETIPRTESWLYLVQYVAGSEAWNCIETDAMCFWSRTYSYKVWHQSFGRIDRLNTPFAKLFYYILDAGTEIEKAVTGSLRAKKSFNEVDYIKSWQMSHPVDG